MRSEKNSESESLFSDKQSDLKVLLLKSSKGLILMLVIEISILIYDLVECNCQINTLPLE